MFRPFWPARTHEKDTNDMTWNRVVETAQGFWRDRSGLAAVEFALFGPLVVFALLAMTDVGMAVYQRMTLDHMLRSAANHAINDPGVPAVEDVLQAIKTTETSGIWGNGEIVFHVARICACAESPEQSVNCTVTCAQSLPTSIYYEMRSDQVVSGLILPAFQLQPEIRVQIR